MYDLSDVKKILLEEDFTCVLGRGEELLTSKQRGIAPLVAWLDTGRDFGGFVAADKIVGRAAALLYVSMGVKNIYAAVLGKDALQVLQENRIAAEYGVLAEHIVNRAGDGICPMERAVEGISDPSEARRVLSRKVADLARKNRENN